MGKKLGALLITIILVLSLVACSGGSYKITVGEIDSSQNELRGEYNSFSGYYFKKVQLKDGENLSVEFLTDTEKGKLIAKVIDADGKTIETLDPGETVKIKQSGKYKMQVEGEKHRGSFTFSWETE